MAEPEHLVAEEEGSQAPGAYSLLASPRMRPRPLVLVSGKGVIGTAGGHESYVRAHALAVARFGFEPHVFCAARRSGTTVTDFATVHDVAAPVPVAAQQPLIARAIVRRFRDEAQPVAIHGFALWASAGALAALMLTRGETPGHTGRGGVRDPHL